MHTVELKPEMFEISIVDAPADLDDLVPRWDAHDRFGIVMHEPLAAVGASLLIQAVIAKFFDHRHISGLDGVPIYPEIYAFHVGRPHGDLSVYDFWPGHKEVFVEDDPVAVAHAVNERAITRLAVPDRADRPHGLLWPEYNSAISRIRSAWAYAPTGRLSNPDVTIRGKSMATVTNTRAALDIEGFVDGVLRSDDLVLATLRSDPDFDRWLARVHARKHEVAPQTRSRIAARHDDDLRHGPPVQTYRRLGVDAALGRLCS